MDFPHGFWESELWKEAARAGLRQISKMVSGGNLAGASRLATTPGVLKPSAAGSQIKHLGRGSEGLATLVAHPEHGVSVRKLYDPRGISTPAMIQRKEEAGRALGNNPNFSRFQGSAPTPHGGGTMHFSEYVPQTPGAPQAKQWAEQTGNQARQALQSVGYEGHDIRKGNMAFDASTGQHKVIDFIPGRAGEMMSDQNSLQVSPKGSHLFGDSPNQSTTKGMLGGMLGGNKPMGVRRMAGVQRPPMAAGTPKPEMPRAPSAADSLATAVTKKPRPPTPGDSTATTVTKKPKPVAPLQPI